MNKCLVDKLLEIFELVKEAYEEANVVETTKLLEIESPALFTGVYPRAVVMSEDDSEKIADRALVPCLFSVNTLEFAAASEKEMLDTK